MATAGCNFHCKFCQAWEISQAAPEELINHDVPPEALVARAREARCPTIAYTVGEPTVFSEYLLDTARAARRAGVHLEITTLVIPTLNDDPARIQEMCAWIARELGPDTPLHLGRFYPLYKLRNLPPRGTPGASPGRGPGRRPAPRLPRQPPGARGGADRLPALSAGPGRAGGVHAARAAAPGGGVRRLRDAGAGDLELRPPASLTRPGGGRLPGAFATGRPGW